MDDPSGMPGGLVASLTVESQRAADSSWNLFHQRYGACIPSGLDADSARLSLCVQSVIRFILNASPDECTTFNNAVRTEDSFWHRALAYACFKFAPRSFPVDDLEMQPMFWITHGRLYLDLYVQQIGRELDVTEAAQVEELDAYFQAWQYTLEFLNGHPLLGMMPEIKQATWAKSENALWQYACDVDSSRGEHNSDHHLGKLLVILTTFPQEASSSLHRSGQTSLYKARWHQARVVLPLAASIVAHFNRFAPEGVHRCALYIASAVVQVVCDLGGNFKLMDWSHRLVVLLAYDYLLRCQEIEDAQLRGIIATDIRLLENAIRNTRDSEYQTLTGDKKVQASTSPDQLIQLFPLVTSIEAALYARLQIYMCNVRDWNGSSTSAGFHTGL